MSASTGSNPRRADAHQRGFRLLQQTRRAIDADKHAAGAERAQHSAAETAGAAAEFDHAFPRLEREFIEQLFGNFREMSVLNFQPAHGPLRLAEHVFGCCVHAIRLAKPRRSVATCDC